MIVLAVIVAVIAALVLIPIKLVVSFHGRLELCVRVLFLRFTIFPRRKEPEAPEPEMPKESPKEKVGEKPKEPPKEPPAKPKEKPKKEPKKEPEKKPEKPPKPEKPAEAEEEIAEEEEGFIDRFLRYYSTIAEFLDPVRRALRRIVIIDELNVAVRVGTLDAADTAVYTGMTWAMAGNLIGLVARFVTIKKRNINVEPAYNESVLAAEGDCIIHTSIANIIGAAAIVAYAYLKFKIKNRRNKK